MPRNYYKCHCGWSMPWAFTPRTKEDPIDIDVGLIIAQHVEKEHPEEIYGDILPTKVYQKWKKLVTPGRG